MFFYLLIVLVTLLVVHYTRKVFYFKNRGFLSLPPSLLYGFETYFQDLTKINLERRAKCGPVYGMWFGNQPLIVVGDPVMVKTILVKEFPSFSQNTAPVKNMPYVGEVFFFKAGNEWKTHRSLVSPVFTTKRIKDIYSHFQKASRPFLSNIEDLIEAGRQDEIDTKDLVRKYSLDVIAKFVFALDLNSHKQVDHPFVKSIGKIVNFDDRLTSIIMGIMPPALFDLISKYYVPMDGESLNYLANTIRYLIKQRKENSGQYNDFLDMHLNAIKEKNVDVPEDELIGNCILFFFAGMETVSFTISNALYCLMLHPEYQDRLYDELIALYPNKEIDYDNIKESPLLDAVLKESQRKFPALNMLFRIAQNPIEIQGYKFKKGDLLGIDVFSLHNSEEYWKNPEKFYPERFLEKDFKIDGDESMTFLPFGAGPRVCIASRMAFIQARYLLAQIILNYEVYRTSKTLVPMKYTGNFRQLNFQSMILGFRKRR